MREWFATRGIYVDIAARQAHNQLALCERHVGILKDTMTKIAHESPDDVTAKEIMSEALDAMNDLGRYKGHSPYEMMLGRTPDSLIADVFGEPNNLPAMYKLGGQSGPTNPV